MMIYKEIKNIEVIIDKIEITVEEKNIMTQIDSKDTTNKKNTIKIDKNLFKNKCQEVETMNKNIK